MTVAQGLEGSSHDDLVLADQDRYTLEGVLGTGGMGKVYQVQDSVLRRVVAMKVIHAYMIQNSVLVARFFEEAQIGAQLQHPNIIPVYDIGQLPSGQHYFTMKQIEGRAFTGLIREVHQDSSPQTWKPSVDGVSCYSLIQVFHKIALAVSYAHAQGVIHRDLKPDNVMLGEYGEIVLFDWGIAKVIGGTTIQHERIETERTVKEGLQTHVGSVAGTPNYMAPEQVAGDISRIGFVSDVYSLGAILYEVLNGRPPFYGLSARQILSRAPSGPPSPLRSLQTVKSGPASGVVHKKAPSSQSPDMLITICERAMAPDIADRYASASLLAEAIRVWMEGVEQQERSLRIVEDARRSNLQALALEASSDASWLQAQHHMAQEGVGSAAARAKWSVSRKDARLARHLHQRYLQQMLGALAYAPQLVEAHRELAQRYLHDLLKASASGDQGAITEHTRQLNQHLDHLPAGEQVALREALQRRLQDTVSRHRLRRGPLIGRQELLTETRTQIRNGVRLISLVGTAGVGKTEVSLELPHSLGDRFARVVFCELTTAQDRQGVLGLVADALQASLRGQDAEGILTSVLRVSSTLLILDNTEHLSAVVGGLCQSWLEQAPSLQIILASRTRLGIAEETVVRVHPLQRLASIELFVRRAHFASGGPLLGQEHWEQVSALVTRLEHLPLAIELAAARLSIFTLEELSERLSARFEVLRTHQGLALSATLDCSWAYLDAQSQSVLAQLSPFRGGFTLEAADAVVQLEGQPDSAPLYEHLETLLDTMLLQRKHTRTGAFRYRLLESIRGYAAMRLQDTGLASGVCRRHAGYYARFGDTSRHERRRADLHHELGNFIAGIHAGDPQTSPLCGLAALQVLTFSGPLSQGLALCTRVLTMSGLSARMKTQLQIFQGTFLRLMGQLEASGRTIAGVVRDVSKLSEPDRRHLAGMLSLERANIALERHETVAAQGWLQDALRAFTLSPDPCGEIDTLNLLGVVTSTLGSSERAREHYTQAVVRSRAIADGPREGASLGNLGVLECEAGAFDAGRGLYQAALKVVKSVDDRRMQALMLGRLGLLEHGQGNLLEARGHYDEAIRVAQEVGLKRSESIFRGNLGNLERSEGNYAAAEVLYLEAIHSSRVCGDRRIESLFMGNLGKIAHARGDLDMAESYYAGALSLAQALSSTRSQSLLTCSLASLERSRKRPEAARALYNEALKLARKSGNRDIEGLVYGNLGELLIDTAQSGEGAKLLRQGIQACDQTFPHAAGIFRVYLALVLVQEQAAAEALRLLDEGERQVAGASEEYITFLCVKAKVFHHIGDRAASQQALSDGRRLAVRIHLPVGSDLQQQLDSIIRLLALDDASTGA